MTHIYKTIYWASKLIHSIGTCYALTSLYTFILHVPQGPQRIDNCMYSEVSNNVGGCDPTWFGSRHPLPLLLPPLRDSSQFILRSYPPP